MALFYRPHIWDKLKEKPKKKKAGGSSGGSNSCKKTVSKTAKSSSKPEDDDYFDDLWEISNQQSGGNADLLGLSAPPVSSAPPSQGGGAGVLVDIFGDHGGESTTDKMPSGVMGNGSAPPHAGFDGFAMSMTPTEDNYKKFVCKHNGVLFENDLLQIGVKSEYRQNLGRITLFYGNKTVATLSAFSADVQVPESSTTKMTVSSKPVDQTVNAGEQKQQQINIECIDDYSEPPTLHIQFLYSGAQQSITARLPAMINKFIESAQMDSATFFSRWKALGAADQECQKIVKAIQPMDTEVIKTKLLGFGSSVLDNVDPNPDNFVMAGILHTRQSQIGALMRLEANKQAMMYRLTVRSSKNSVATCLSDLLESQL